MKKKMLSLGLLAIAAFVFCSCADGFDDGEIFSSDVRNAQLVSPELNKSCFTTVNTDAGEQVQVTWPLIKGAGGYKVRVEKVGADGNTTLINDSIVDGLTVLFPRDEDTKYDVSVQTMGNAALNNATALEPSKYEYLTMVAGVTVEGTDVAQFVNKYISEHAAEMDAAMAEDPNNYEMAFELEAGKQYTLNDSVDFRLYPITLRSSDKTKSPTVVVGEKGYLTTQGGLKVKYVNFDCTQMTALGLLTLGANPDSTLTTEALGYKALGGSQNCFVIQKSIMFQGCMAKNIANGVLCNNTKKWALNDFTINDCIFQFVNEGTNPIINMYGSGSGAGTGGILNMTIKNTSFVNLKDNSSTYFMRFSNGSNAIPKKIWGDGVTGSFVLQNCTFVKCMSNKDFANNYGNSGSIHTLKWKNNIFYDTRLLQKAVRNNTVDFTVDDNTIWSVAPRTVDLTDKTKYATEEDPGFTTPAGELDLTQPNGGYNLTPTGSKAVAGQFGDPRWY